MELTAEAIAVFAYRAQTREGHVLTGTLDAPDADAARGQLAALGLRLIEIEVAPEPPRARPLRGEDFAAFNQQLAHLTAAGLPVEHGLRLIAQDLRGGRLADTVRAVAAELERGQSLPEAFEAHRRAFPPLYSKLVEAGVKSHNLPGVLLNLGRHLELLQRLRGTLWRAAAYPLLVVGGLSLVLAFLALYVLPQFKAVFADFNTTLPASTQLLIDLIPVLKVGPLVLVGLILCWPVVWALVRMAGWEPALVELCVMPLPLVGRVTRCNLLARWCDALKLGVEAGLDLPAALTLAGEAVDAPGLRADTKQLVALVEGGRPLDALQTRRMMPATVTAAIDLSAQRGGLPATLESLARMYQEQAELRLGTLQAFLTPVLLCGIAVFVGFVVVSMTLPLLSLIQSVTPG